MESSEDDAGAATNASRRASAREKDVGGGEDGGGTPLGPADPAAACETASSAEEAFDADSVPSPSQDVNTSTEAILDMIDEIVDGPCALRRRSLVSTDVDATDLCTSPADDATDDPPPPSDPGPETTSALTMGSATSAKSETVSQETVNNLLSESINRNEPTNDVCVEKVSSIIVNNIQEECISEPPTGKAPSEEMFQESSINLHSQQTSESCTSVTEAVTGSVDIGNPQAECPQQEVLLPDDNARNISTESCIIKQIACRSPNEVQSDVDTIHTLQRGSVALAPSILEQARHTQSPQASSSAISNEVAESTSEEVLMHQSCDAPSSFCPSIPSSSGTEMVQNVSDSSENLTCERTMKCVTSSDIRDNVTVESAESTSSDNSVTFARAGVSESAKRSPLRRRLVRPAPSEVRPSPSEVRPSPSEVQPAPSEVRPAPSNVQTAPSDRRPDSTVSSSMDSQNINVHTTKQMTSESVTKDVSSSSDAVSSVYCSVKPEEIRNVSEINVCKAETSKSPPKKIKLVRQKVTPSVSPRDNIPENFVFPRSEQCQSTSECTPSASKQPVSSNNIVSQIVQSEDVNSGLNNEYVGTDSIAKTSAKDPEKDSQKSGQDDHCFIQPSIRGETSGQSTQKKVPPIKLNLSTPTETSLETKSDHENPSTSRTDVEETSESAKQIPKLTIKIGNKQTEEVKVPIPKLTIKPIRPPLENEDSKKETNEQIPSIPKLTIKPIPKPPEKINDIHRKSSSSEISESESSENDESNGMSDQTSNSDQSSHQSSDVVPKVTIKVGKPGTKSEGKFYTEQNAPKLLIKGIQSTECEAHESTSKLKLAEKQPEKIPKLTIKTVAKSEGQPLSPKLTIKPLKPPEIIKNDSLEESVEKVDVKENTHVPKITIKPIVKTDSEFGSKTPKKSSSCNSPENIPVVTKLNIKPILKPIECEATDHPEQRVPVVSKLHIKPIVKPVDSSDDVSEDSESQIPVISKLNIKPILKPTESGNSLEIHGDIPLVAKLNIKPILKTTENCDSSGGIQDKVPVVTKLNIKPIVKPKDNDIESNLEDIPKITKLNIKPLRNPEAKSSEEKDCDVLIANTQENSIPVVTKINIKPIVKPVEEDASKDSENQSSETGNSSDDNSDIPVVTKINIKPIMKPSEAEDSTKINLSNEGIIPVVTKLNIKPLVKPEECKAPPSPKRESLKITKLNIKPVVKPDEVDQQKVKNDTEDTPTKNPPLLMKINMKDVTCSEKPTDKRINNIEINREHLLNNVDENIPKVSKINIKPILSPESDNAKRISVDTSKVLLNCKQSSTSSLQAETSKLNCVPDLNDETSAVNKQEQSKDLFDEKSKTLTRQKPSSILESEIRCLPIKEINRTNESITLEDICNRTIVESVVNQAPTRLQSNLQNCTLLKKLLETKKDGLDKRLEDCRLNVNHSSPTKTELKISKEVLNCDEGNPAKSHFELPEKERNTISNQLNDLYIPETGATCRVSKDTSKESKESLPKPLEISIPDKNTNQSSGQDSPRIILKINKTDHGSSAKIITEERPATPQQNEVSENTREIINDGQSQKKVVYNRKKSLPDTPNVPMGKRLRSSRIVEEKSSLAKRNTGKRPSTTETSPVQKEPELSVLETKRLKLGQLLSNKSLGNSSAPTNIAPLLPMKTAQVSLTKSNLESKPTPKTINHSHLNNENCSKNGNSKLHNILSNLQAKQAQALALSETSRSDKEKAAMTPELESGASTSSSDVVEVVPVPAEQPAALQELLLSESSTSRDLLAPSPIPVVVADDATCDPLQVPTPELTPTPEMTLTATPTPELTLTATPTPTPPLTPQPKRRGRPRKLPLSEGARPAPLVLPVPALEERPQRSLRLSRDRPTPTILAKPRGRGRGRGRGARRSEPARPEPAAEPPAEEDPTSSRVKLPRMTEALDKLPGTPLSSRRRSSEAGEPKVVLSLLPEALCSPPETPRRGGRGSRGGRGRGTPRTPRAHRGRGRGGGRGAMYMKETMGIYGRVCGPATTTVQLFEEETCMMDDNATPAKPLQFDEDSQSSVRSSTNDSSKMKKSKFADLFDSNKIWTAADVKEYTWPPPETSGVEHQVMMIQEQVAMFLGVKSFKRRYPELKRRPITADERDFVLSKELVTEALCDLGITAVDASEVLDIMLSDYPHKYEEYRSHQRQKQRAEAAAEASLPIPTEETTQDTKDKIERVEMKPEPKPEPKPAESKPEPPKVDLEKSRQEAMAAAIASASEWNTRMNALRRGAYVDLQTHTVHRRRTPIVRAPEPRVRPAAGFYPHALLPGQYQHHYRTYTAEQLRYFPLNTVVAAPPAPPSPAPSDSDSEPDWSSSSADDSATDRPPAKRKKLTKTKRSSQAEASSSKEEVKEEPAELCRVCKLRLEANRKYTHERFLVCAHCNAKLHPGCVELNADTIRKAREYAWQCAECKSCCSCQTPGDDDKMLFCDLCDRGFHIYCVGLDKVPSGRWHCVECAKCKSCGAREPGGPPTAGPSGAPVPGEEATWHHQTKRGPGGHKVYSHSLCTPCARAYRIGRYCPLCERSFIGPKGTMQLVICKLCDRQHHQECVKQTTVSALNVLDYTCGECRRGGITSRAAAARLAPRTIATLFMAKRRFNKYAHRQYLASRAAAADTSRDSEPDPPEAVLAADVSDTSDAGDAPEPADPLEGAGDPLAAASDAPDEAAAAVAALAMDFGD